MAYDPKCLELAEHFIGSRVPEPLRSDLAQHIQDEIELWIVDAATALEAEKTKLRQVVQ